MTDVDTAAEHQIFVVSTSGADIIGFDPAKDKLDLGDNSVHNFIVVDTPTGVGFMDPWSGNICIIQGVSLAQLTIDSFLPIVNDHLRQTLSGALAWEHGIVEEPHTVYARSHELGQIDKVAFDPATDTVDMRYFGTREQIYMSDSAEGVIISNSGTGQALILLGVTKAELTVDNFVFYAAEVREDRVHLQLGFTTVPDSQVLPQGVDIAGTNTWPTAAGGGDAPTGTVGTTFTIDWHYGVDTVLEFNPAADKLDFGWFKGYEFDVTEVNGSTVISITGNHQTYTLHGVTLGELEINNIVALDTTARAEWQGLIDAAPPPAAKPVINLADGQVVEGDAGTTMMNFVVTLSHASDSPVSVSYSTLNGSATADADYSSAVGTVTFAAGETQKVISIAVLGDTLHEFNENFSVQLSSPSGAVINDGSAVGTIVDNDADTAPTELPAISIADIQVVEGDVDMAHFRFQVTLSKASTETITVHYSSSDLTATGGTDYEILDGTITFAPGETTQTIHAHMYSDTTIEPDETYKVTLSAPTNATIADGTAIATIVNDDAAVVVLPTVSIGDASIVEGNAGSSALSFTVSLSAASAEAVTISYATTDGTATAGSDYTAKTGTVTFAPGETSKVVQVAVNGDTAVEANETFTVKLTNPTGATIAHDTATATITNDDVASVPTGGYGLDYDVTSDWTSGFTANMTVEAGTTALSGWTVEFDATFTITNIWNAVIVSHVGNHYVIKDASYNSAVGAGKTTAFGFQATPGANGSRADGFVINGHAAGDNPAPVLPTLSVSDASVTEGHSGMADMAFTISLSAASATAVTVAYGTANGTALAGLDYTAASGTVTFAPGETTKIVHIQVAGDTVVETNETFLLNLSAPTGATLADAQGTGTIVNDDVAVVLPTVSVSDATLVEGNSGSSAMSFTVTLSAASATAVSVAYGTSNGTATAGSDYTAASGTVTFAPGETSKTIQVMVLGDSVVEANEAFTVNLSAPSGATLADGSGTGTITNDDVAVVPPTVSIADASIVEGNSGSAAMSFTVSLSKASTEAVTITYSTADGTATAGSDYTAKTGTVTFAPGETSKVVQVAVNGDTAVESNETFSVNLSSPAGATIGHGTATATITNDDTASVPTGGAGLDYDVTSNWTSGFTASMSVEAGTTALSGWTVEFDATFTITNIWNAVIVSHVGNHYVIKDAGYNSAVGAGKDTAFGFQATPGAGGTTATGFLVNGHAAGDNPAPVLPTLAVSDAAVLEGNSGTTDMAFTITLSAAAATAVTVAYGTANGTAIAGSDFAAASGTVTFAPGETSKVVHVQVATDTVVEANETFTLNLSAPNGAILADGQGIGTITNDDVAVVVPTASVSDASVTEGNSGTKDLVFTVSLSQAATGPVSLHYATADGTATAGSDYAAAAGTVTFAAGETTKEVHVTVSGDTVVEGTETLTLNLSAPSGATIADGQGTGTITNDDVAPVVPTASVADASVTEGASGTTDLAFTVTLSQATTGPVTLHYATADGTATAGSDYAAATGNITFAAGETSKVVHIQVNGDTAVEASETLKLILSQPSGATIATGTATGTIVNDDAPAGGSTPTVSIGDTTVTEGNPAVATETGYFSTSGNQIIDADGHSVQIAGVNWFGFEGDNESPNGLWTRGYKDMMQQMVDEGFNTIRLPFSSDMLHSTRVAQGIDYSKNPDLAGLDPIQVMDKIVEYAGEIGLKIILDHHRSDDGAGTSANGLWYDANHSEASWISDWQMLAARYANDPTIIGADLHNEPYNGTWGGGGANDWARAAEAAGNAIGDVNPNWLIFVEGIGTYDGQSYWWGGNLMGVADRPIELDVDNKLVYSAHDYPNSVYPQPWFQGANFADDLPAKFDQMWGYIYREGIAPVYVGEFGTNLTDPKDAPWLKAITAYLGGDFNNDGVKDIPADQHGPSWTFWSWNPNSGDTGGILKDDWSSVNENKMVYLTPIEAPFPALDGTGGGEAPGVHADFQVTLSEASSVAVSVEYHTVALDAAAGSDFTATSGTVIFQPGETTKVISIAITADKVAESTEHFGVTLSNPVGITVAHDTGTGTILDNDGGGSTPTNPTNPTNPTTPGDADLHGSLTVVDSWNSGFNVNVAVHNDGTIPTTGWQVKVDMPYEIASIWNAEIVSHDADGYVIRNAAWNGSVGADAEVNFGFTGTGHLDAHQVDLIF